MSWYSLLFVALIGAVVAALAEGTLAGVRPGWSARRRVFTAALVGPGLLIASPLCLALALMAWSPDPDVAALAPAALVNIAVTSGLAALAGGLVMAFIMERKILR